MGREIRRVPPNWQHPKDESGRYKPMMDCDYATAAQEWLEELLDWENDKDGERTEVMEKHDGAFRYYWDWDGPPPDEDYYLPTFTEEPTHYQIYENVTEGTPVSPVFASTDEMKSWLLAQGFTETAADKFIEWEYAPSMIMTRSGIGMNIAGLDMQD